MKNIGKIDNFEHRNELFIALEWERGDKFYSSIIDLKKIAKKVTNKVQKMVNLRV